MKILSRVEELILIAILRVKDESYCVPVFEELNKISAKKWTLGSMYPPLYRLEEKGLLRSFMGDPTSQRGGKSKRYYQVTEAGMDALKEIKKLNEMSWNGIEDFLK